MKRRSKILCLVFSVIIMLSLMPTVAFATEPDTETTYATVGNDADYPSISEALVAGEGFRDLLVNVRILPADAEWEHYGDLQTAVAAGLDENGNCVKYYDNLDTALAADHAMVKLLDDVDSATIESGKTVTIDLNGKNIGTLTNNGTLSISGESGNITTLNGSGTVNCDHKGGQATCTQKAACEVCTTEYGNFAPHNLTRTDAVPATCTDPGVKEYWSCFGCLRVYKDANGENETTVEDETIAINSANHSGTTKTRKHDAGQHWYEWDCCGALDGEKTNHSGGTATCQSKAVCTICSAHYGEKAAHNYDTTTWSYKEDDGHAHNCKTTGCTVHDTVVGHTPGASATETSAQTCTECGYEIAPKLEHMPVLVEGYDATTSAPGKKDYYHCESCGKNYVDITSMHEITGDIDEWGIIPMIIAIVEGNGQEWAKGTKADLRFKSNADFANFSRVEIDGVKVDASNYTVAEGSTVVALKAAYLETLSVGEHEIVIVSANDTPEAKFTVKEAAATAENNGNTSHKTGDNINMLIWIILLFVSFGGLATTAVYKKRKADR